VSCVFDVIYVLETLFYSQTLLYALDAYIDCVCILFSPNMLSPVF
jgi:hypothetical protein